MGGWYPKLSKNLRATNHKKETKPEERNRHQREGTRLRSGQMMISINFESFRFFSSRDLKWAQRPRDMSLMFFQKFKSILKILTRSKFKSTKPSPFMSKAKAHRAQGSQTTCFLSRIGNLILQLRSKMRKVLSRWWCGIHHPKTTTLPWDTSKKSNSFTEALTTSFMAQSSARMPLQRKLLSSSSLSSSEMTLSFSKPSSFQISARVWLKLKRCRPLTAFNERKKLTPETKSGKKVISLQLPTKEVAVQSLQTQREKFKKNTKSLSLIRFQSRRKSNQSTLLQIHLLWKKSNSHSEIDKLLSSKIPHKLSKWVIIRKRFLKRVDSLKSFQGSQIKFKIIQIWMKWRGKTSLLLLT